MKKLLQLLVIFTFLNFSKAFCAQKEWINLSSSVPAKEKISLLSADKNSSEVQVDLAGFYTTSVETPEGPQCTITFPGGAANLETGMPDLSSLTFSVIIPDNADMKIDVQSSRFRDYNLAIAPSKGNLKRNILPSSVQYSYSDIYSQNTFSPAEITHLRTPFILRDYRGQTAVITPFQYNPVTKTLRVYYSLRIKISPSAPTASINKYNRLNSPATIDASFKSIYNSEFLNYSVYSYVPVSEHGNMLVIAYPDFMNAMQPFVDWKNSTGQPTELVSSVVAGNTPEDIKMFIQNYYDNNSLTYVLLVGDGPQIPPFASVYGDSDPSYGYLAGNDSYAEVFVGRFSANDSTELITQIQRSLKYEMHPDPAGQWYHKGVCIGSDQGPGDDNEMDFEHERNIRTDYLNYTYTDVDELYDGAQGGADDSNSPTPLDLNNALNDGRSVITYTGHGSSSSLGTTGYSIADLSGLHNNDQLPFIWSVACVNGDFNLGTCLAEGLMRSVSPNGEATGAVATFMSTINQSWDPPMDGQDEMVDVLTELVPGNIRHTFGAISESGCMHMNDQYGADGDEMTDTWTIFGDPSLMVRTKTPHALAITHDATVGDNAIYFYVSCAEAGTTLCLSSHGEIVSTAHALSGYAILNLTGLNAGDTLSLVATAYNAIPYFSNVIVVPSVNTGILNLTDKSIALYPNPSTGIFNFAFNSDSEKHIRIINTTGQTVEEITSANRLMKINMSGFSRGIYFAIITDNNKSVINKLIVE